MSISLNFNDKEDLLNQLATGELHNTIYDYVKDTIAEHEYFKHKSSNIYSTDMTKDNVIDYFDLNEWGYILNKEEQETIHTIIYEQYDKYMSDEYCKITLSSEMTPLEIFKSISDLVPFEKVEHGYYISFLMDDGFSEQAAEQIYYISNDLYLKYEHDFSKGKIIETISSNINEGNVSLTEVRKMKRGELLDAVLDNHFVKSMNIEENDLEI